MKKNVEQNAQGPEMKPVPGSRLLFSEPEVKNEKGRTEARCIDPDGHMFQLWLTPQSTAFYMLKGTINMLDPTTKRTLSVMMKEKTSGELKKKDASLPLYVKFPKGKETLTGLTLREIEMKVHQLLEKFRGQHAAAMKSGKLLVEMTLTEISTAFGEEAALAFSEKSKARRVLFRQNINHMAGELQEIPMGKLKKKELMSSLPKNASAATKCGYLQAFRFLVKFVEDEQCVVSGLALMIDDCIKKLTDGKKERERKERKAALDASNSKVLSNEGEEELNRQIKRRLDDPYYASLLLIKGGGLEPKEICMLKVKDVKREKGNPREGKPDVIFIDIRRAFASATQNYCFPIFPWEAGELCRYLDSLATSGGERMAEDRYLFSKDDGTTPLDPVEISKLCRAELQKLKSGFADLIGNVDLKRTQGVRMLLETYADRLSEYAGIDKEKDEGAYRFMCHRSLGSSVQADHYRSFSGESGRKCLLDYVSQDRRFLKSKMRRGEKGRKTEGDLCTYTLYAKDDVNEQQAAITIELGPGEVAEFFAEHGIVLEILEVKPLEA